MSAGRQQRRAMVLQRCSAMGQLRFLLLLLIHCCRHAAANPPQQTAGPPQPQLPELDRQVETLVCEPGGCSVVSNGTIPKLCTTLSTVLVHDQGACYAAAIEHAGYRPFDLSKCSGGELIMCKQLLRLLNVSGYSFLATKSVPALEACVAAGQARGVEHVLVQHGVNKQLVGDEMVGKAHRLRPPFREECLISMTLWGGDRPNGLWPGDLRYYVTSFPTTYNSHVLMRKRAQCPTATAFQPPRLPPYGVLFEKFKVMPAKVNRTEPFSHNATFWAEMRRRVHLVVLDCSDELAAKMGWGPDYRKDVTCWKESPLSKEASKEVSYRSLMMGAQFFLGLGATPQSPTPVDLNYCRTPVIMPPHQHSFIPKHAGPHEYYPATAGEEVLRAVDYIMENCKVEFVRDEASGAVTKTNTCFQDPPSLDEQMDEYVLAKNLKKLMHTREVSCYNKPKKIALAPESKDGSGPAGR